jgi:DNA-3-methyladenine glycosylase
MILGLNCVVVDERKPEPLRRAQLPRAPITLARALIGKRLVRVVRGKTLVGRIVETEAYLSDDAASHSFAGPTPRNGSMYLRRGHAYIYRIYGIWLCLNISAGHSGDGAAVLLRALVPMEGVRAMQANRGGANVRDLARGPGRLCQALAIDPTLDGLDLCSANGVLWLAAASHPVGDIGVSARIGITQAADLPLRFYERGNLFVSGPARLRL